jgi:serine/threonine protein kinase/tetratricopeptide (TPR) repeat protein
MAACNDAHRDLLFGLLALTNGMVRCDQLVAAFGAWTVGGKAMADHLVEHGALAEAHRSLLEALAEAHLKIHAGDPEKSLEALELSPSARESLARIGDPDVQASLARIGTGSDSNEGLGAADPNRTTIYAVGTATSHGQRFRVLRPHARGGLGAVFVALDTELHREVALKQILDEHADDPSSRQRFVLEAEVTGGLEHPGVVPVYGLGTYDGGRPYYTMRFIGGESLEAAIERFHAANVGCFASSRYTEAKAEALRRASPGSTHAANDHGRRTLELHKLLRRFTDVCNAIGYAHSRGVLHRDIKPGNVIVGKYGETLVVDWGVAKATGQCEPDSGERTLQPSSASGSAETLPGSILGTPAYMSPEQAAGDLEHLGPRCDVYSLGATLYCLLTGKPPFTGALCEVIPAVQRGDFLPPRQLDPSIDRALEAVCLKAMALKPHDRYDSPRALAEDIERWVADEPVSACCESWSRRARRWARRNRSVVAAAAVAILAGLIGLGAVTAVQARANAALRAAYDAKDQALAVTQQAQAQTQAALEQSEQARQRALSAEKTARSEADKARAVNDFLTQDLLTQAEPKNTAAEDHVSLLEVLDRAAAKVGDRFAGQPEVEDALRRTIARTYHGLGSWEKAERQWRAVLEAARRRLGGENPQALLAAGELAHILRHRGQTDAEVFKLLRSAAEGLARALGPDHPDTLNSRVNLGNAYLEAGRTSEAIALYETTLKQYESNLGPDHADTLGTRSNLAIAYYYAGRTAEAIAMHEVILKRHESKLGPDHPETLQSRNNLAIAYWTAGRTAEAIAMHEVNLKLREVKLGPDHPYTLGTRSNLANAYRTAGRTAEAITLEESTLELREAKLGPDHPSTLSSRSGLATAYLDAGRTAEAMTLHEGTLKLREVKLGPDHPDTLRSRNHLATAYEALGRRAEAEALRRDALARRRRGEKPDSPLLADDLDGLGHNLLEQGRWSEAESLLRESLAIGEKVIPDEWRRFNTMSQLGGALLGQGRHAEAEPLIVRGFEGLKAREPRIPADGKIRLHEGAERVVRLYEAWGKPEEVTAWKAKLGLTDLPTDVFAPAPGR